MWRVLWTTLIVFIPLLGTFAANGFGGAPAKPKRVLVLYSHRYALPINQQWERGIRAGIEANLREQVAIDNEYLDLQRLKTDDDRRGLMDLLRLKYEALEPDVVIPVDDAAAKIFTDRAPFPNAAVVFCSIQEKTRERLPVTSQMTGVIYRWEPRRTVQCARRLLPAARNAIVISGTGADDLVLLERIKADLTGEREIELTYWTGVPIDDVCARAAELPRGSFILFNSFLRDRNGEIPTVPRDVLQRISQSANVPVFGLYDTLLGAGIVGGCIVPVEEQGRRAGEVAARVLQGERPRDIPFSGTEMNRFIFDWRQLRRWGIRERDLPPEAVVLFRGATVWEQYGAYITAGVTAIALQSLLIVALLVNRRRRLRAESALADRLRFETMLSDLSSRFVHVAQDGVEREIEYTLARVVEHLALDRGTAFTLTENGLDLRTVAASVRLGEARAPEVLPLASIPWLWAKLNRGDWFHFSSLTDVPKEAGEEKKLMLRLGLKAGVAVALNVQGTVVGLLAFGQLTRAQTWDETILQRLKLVGEVVANALAHARADKALATSRREARQLAGRLLTAQEDERKRLARDMHDDVSQRLAAAAIEAGKVEQLMPAAGPSRAAIAGLREHLIALSDEVHRLSRQLHPAILDDLGLQAAIRAECDRLAERERMAVNFRCGRLPTRLPKDLALCLYRIAQEALRNVVKHAQTDRVDLILNADLEFVYLEVRDFGRGFDPAVERSQPGLGLASMEERVRLVGGELVISSTPGQGTCIQVRIPLPEEDPL